MTFISALTRRNFFGVTARAAASLVAPQGSARESNGLVGAQAPSAAPQALTALPNLSGQARAFTNAERQARIERASQLMTSAKIDAIVLANSTSSSVYFANLRLYGGERLWALVLPTRSKPFLVCPAFEEGRAGELLAAGPLAGNVDVLIWQEDESPYLALGKGLSDRGLGGIL